MQKIISLLPLLLACPVFAQNAAVAASTAMPAIALSTPTAKPHVEVSTATPDAAFQKEYGVIKAINFTPAEYPLQHVALYYLPKSAAGKTFLKTLVVLHGGGEGTRLSTAAVATAISYMKSVVPYAEQNSMAIIAPTSPIGWNGKSQLMRMEVMKKARRELPLDPDGFYMWGHSMGGMGISRDVWAENDRYAAFVMNSAGMQPQTRASQHMYAYLNAKLVHLQGRHDSFETFVPWSEEEISTMTALAKETGMPLQYELIYYDGTHQPDMPLLFSTLDRLLKTPRNPYPSDFFSIIGCHSANADMTGYCYDGNFWLDAPGLTPGNTSFELLARATATPDNKINIAIHGYEGRIKTLRVYVSGQFIDLSKPVEVYVNGTKAATRPAGAADYARGLMLAQKRGDTGFVYEDYIDIPLPTETTH